MIPKKIHYCWLSGDKVPKQIQECIQSWQNIMPEYELILWDKNRFDISSVQFVAEACSVKKWASAADYIRLYAVYTEGGIYLDSDVMIHKKFDDFLQYDFFTSLEYDAPKVERYNSSALLNIDGTLMQYVPAVRGIQIQAAIFGSIKNHPYLQDCMSWYENNRFLCTNADGGRYNTDYIAPDIFARVATNYGFKYKDEQQLLKNNMMIFPSCYFAGDPTKKTEKSYATHLVAHSWVDKTLKQKLKETNIYKMYQKIIALKNI